jgi:predicted nucleic acid-binding protein
VAFIAFLDACTLYPASLRDVLLTVAEAGVCQIRWSVEVLDEMQRNVAKRARAASPKQAEDGARYTRAIMEAAFPDAMVDTRAYRALVDRMTNDEGDRHVLAAAIAGRADVIVTANVHHFPETACEPYGIDVQDPDAFLVHQFELAPDRFLSTLGFLSSQRRSPMDSVEGILNSLVRLTPRFCALALTEWRGRQGKAASS